MVPTVMSMGKERIVHLETGSKERDKLKEAKLNCQNTDSVPKGETSTISLYAYILENCVCERELTLMLYSGKVPLKFMRS